MIKRIHLLTAAFMACTAANVHAQRVMVTWAGTGTVGMTGDNKVANTATITTPTDICIDDARNIYINGGNRVRKIDARTGVITTYAGGGSSTADGVLAINASLGNGCICLDPAGNLYIVNGNRIRKVDAITGIITTIAGTTSMGSGGDGGPAISANLSSPYGICSDVASNIYIADVGNGRIRKVDAATGVISTIAGTGALGYTGDGGPALSATMNRMSVICVSNTGDVFFSDQNGTRIRRIAAGTGVISHIAGFGSGLFGTGNGGPAAVACVGNVNGICIDGSGDLYIDDDSCACRKIDMTTGIIDIVAGDMHAEGYNGDEADALLKWFNWPKGVCVDAEKNLYVADRSNNRIRKAILLSSSPAFAYGKGQSIMPCSSAAVPLSNVLAVVDKDPGQTETWTIITPPAAGVLNGFPASGVSAGSAGVVKPASVSYTPAAYYVADDSFQVMVWDGTYADTVTIHVRVPEMGVISGPAAVCVGAAINLSQSVPGGVWSTTGSLVSLTTSGDVTGLMPGTAHVLYVLSDAVCGSVYTSKDITVDGAPDAGTIFGAEHICAGATYLWTNIVAGGAWSTDNGNATYISGGFFMGSVAGVDTIRYTVTNTCGTASATKPVVVDPLPDAGSISSSADEVCVGGNITLGNTAIGGGWTVNNANASINGSGTLTGLTPGMVTVNYSVTNTCGTEASSKDIIVEDCIATNVGNVQPHNIAVYPNPASATLTIEWGIATDNIAVVITDVTGKAVVSTISPAGSKLMNINVSDIAEGIYMLSIKGNGINEKRKIVVGRK